MTSLAFNPDTGESVPIGEGQVKEAESAGLLTGKRAQIAADLARSQGELSKIDTSPTAKVGTAMTKLGEGASFGLTPLVNEAIYGKAAMRNVRKVQEANSNTGAIAEGIGGAASFIASGGPLTQGAKAITASLGIAGRAAKGLEFAIPAAARIAALDGQSVATDFHEAHLASAPIQSEALQQHVLWTTLAGAFGEGVVGPIIEKLAPIKAGKKALDAIVNKIYKPTLAMDEIATMGGRPMKEWRGYVDRVDTTPPVGSPSTALNIGRDEPKVVVPSDATMGRTHNAVSDYLNELRRYKDFEGAANEIKYAQATQPIEHASPSDIELTHDPFDVKNSGLQAPVAPIEPAAPIGRGKGGNVTPMQHAEYAQQREAFKQAQASHLTALDDYHAAHLDKQAQLADDLNAAKARAEFADTRSQMSGGQSFDEVSPEARDQFAQDAHLRDIMGHGPGPIPQEDLLAYSQPNPYKPEEHAQLDMLRQPQPPELPPPLPPKVKPLVEPFRPVQRDIAPGPKIKERLSDAADFELNTAGVNERNLTRKKYEPITAGQIPEGIRTVMAGGALRGGAAGYAGKIASRNLALGGALGGAIGSSVLGYGGIPGALGGAVAAGALKLIDNAAVSYLNRATVSLGDAYVDTVAKTFLTNTRKAVAALTKAGAAQAFALTHNDIDKEYQALTQATNQSLSSPDLANSYIESNVGPYLSQHPQTYEQAVGGYHQAVGEIGSMAPTQQGSPVIGAPPVSVTHSEKRRFVTHAKMVGNVSLGLSNPTAQIIAYYNQAYPASMAAVKEHLVQQISDPKVLNKMSQDQKRRVSTILGKPVGTMNDPNYIATLQQMAQASTMGGQQAQQGQGKPASGPSGRPPKLSPQGATAGAPGSLQAELP